VSPLKSIEDVILSFYNVEEIICAKETLLNEPTKLNLLDVPRLLKHQGDSRVRTMLTILPHVWRRLTKLMCWSHCPLLWQVISVGCKNKSIAKLVET